MALDAVVAVNLASDFFGSLQQLGRMGKAVVALAEGFPFALFNVQLIQFVKLPFQTLRSIMTASACSCASWRAFFALAQF